MFLLSTEERRQKELEERKQIILEKEKEIEKRKQKVIEDLKSTNPLDRNYRASKQKEIEEQKQGNSGFENPLDRIYRASKEKEMNNVPELSDEQSLPTPIKSLPTPIPVQNWQYRETVKKLEIKIKETEKPKQPPKKEVAKYEDVKNLNLFICGPSGIKTPFTSAENFKKYLNSPDHKKSMDQLKQLHENTLNQLRTYAQLLEIRKNVGKTGVKISQRCELCQMSVYGNMAKHRTSKLHLKIKKFVHPMCEICDMSFQKRWVNLKAFDVIKLERSAQVGTNEEMVKTTRKK